MIDRNHGSLHVPAGQPLGRPLIHDDGTVSVPVGSACQRMPLWLYGTWEELADFAARLDGLVAARRHQLR